MSKELTEDVSEIISRFSNSFDRIVIHEDSKTPGWWVEVWKNGVAYRTSIVIPSNYKMLDFDLLDEVLITLKAEIARIENR